MTGFVEPSRWYARQAAVYVTACAVITDPDDRLLMVKPSYREHWQLPGGYAEDGERPDECVVREVAEETGLTIVPSRLLLVDWSPAAPPRPRPVTNWIFDGGALPERPRLRLPGDREIEEIRWVAWAEAARLISPNTAARIPAVRRARSSGAGTYLPLARRRG